MDCQAVSMFEGSCRRQSRFPHPVISADGLCDARGTCRWVLPTQRDGRDQAAVKSPATYQSGLAGQRMAYSERLAFQLGLRPFYSSSRAFGEGPLYDFKRNKYFEHHRSSYMDCVCSHG